MSVRLAVFLLGCLLAETVAAKQDASTSVYHIRKLLEVGCSSGCEAATLPNDSGVYIETCRVEPKTDLSCAELGSEPAEQPCQCCFVCRVHPDCHAWVHRTDTMRCYYKKASYDACNKVKCDTCVASKPSGGPFYTCTKRVTEATKWRRSEEASKSGKMVSLAELKESAGDSKYGKGVLVGVTSTPNVCCFGEGFDQPAEFNLLEKPLILTSAYDCCNACRQNSMCKSWVWKKATFECFLKAQYDESRNTIACPSCFGYKSSSSKYFYIEQTRSKGQAGKEKYTELVKTYSGVYHEGQTGTSTEQSKTPSPSRPTYRTPSRSPPKFPSPSRSPPKFPSPSRSPPKFPSPSRSPPKFPSPSRSPPKFPSPSRSPPKFPSPSRSPHSFPSPSRGPHSFPSTSWSPHSLPSPSRSPHSFPSSSKISKPSPSPSREEKYGKLTLTIYHKPKAGEKEGKQETTGKGTGKKGQEEKPFPSPSVIQTKKQPSKTAGRTTGTTKKKEESGSTFQKETYHCPYIRKYDQPTEYDMFPQPFKFDRPEECCRKYHETEGCKSWVYHTKTKRCHLKNKYYPEESKIPCTDCMAYYEAKPSIAVLTT